MKDYPYLSTAVARVLIRKREEARLSKRRTADDAQIERVYLIHLERGERRPTLNAIFHLCDALHVTPLEFLKEVMDEMEKLKAEEMKKPSDEESMKQQDET